MPRSGPAAGGSPPPPQAAPRPPAITPAASKAADVTPFDATTFDDDLRAPRLGDRLAAAAAAARRARRALGTRGGLPRYGIRGQPARVRGSPYRREDEHGHHIRISPSIKPHPAVEFYNPIARIPVYVCGLFGVVYACKAVHRVWRVSCVPPARAPRHMRHMVDMCHAWFYGN